MKQHYDKGARNLIPLLKGQTVRVRINNDWIPGKVIGIKGLRSYLVRISHTGNILRRNRKHLITDNSPVSESPMPTYYDDLVQNGNISSSALSPVQQLNSDNTACSNYYRTRFGRIVRPPDRWGYPTVVPAADH
ncbi:hypothetical protein ACJJTC_010661 [Scirpophaga incertulas]